MNKRLNFRERRTYAAMIAIADRYWQAHLKRWPLKRVYGKPTGVILSRRVITTKP